MGWRPENRNSAWDFLQKYSPVAFRTDRRISLATGEWQFRVGLPQKKFSGRISSRRRIAISFGTSSHITLGHYFQTRRGWRISHVSSSPRRHQSRLMPPEHGDFAWDFLDKRMLVPSPTRRRIMIGCGTSWQNNCGSYLQRPNEGDFAFIWAIQKSSMQPFVEARSGAW